MPDDIAWNGYIPNDEPPPHETIPDAAPDIAPDTAPVKENIIPLGHDRGVFYYLSLSAKQVFALQAGQHSKNTLMAMASVPYYWQRTSFCNEKGKIDWEAATDHLMRSCRDVGIYDPDRVRGRGAWLDDGRAVLHTGDRLIVDGCPCDLMLPGSRHIYEAAKPLTGIASAPLSNADAHKLVQICQMLKFERGLDGLLLAGFLAVAPVCGGLAWRPSIWITGPAGSGKTYAEENIITPSLGGMALQVQSKTSEAGIRQALSSDARPVIFGEAESEDAGAAARMQGVLDLVRQSASEGGAEIIKGSQDQKAARRFRIRSCFLFSSINVALQHHADETRVTVLGLKLIPSDTEAQREASAAQFDRLKALVSSTITADFSSGLLARSTKYLPIIRANAETFARAVAARLGSRRLGDQLGTLLAGAWSLHATRGISEAEALEWIDKQDWSGEEESSEDRDEYRLLAMLTQHRVRVATGNGSSYEPTIGRLLHAALARDSQIMRETAETELLQLGFKAAHDPQGVYVSTNHPAIKRQLIGTPWAANWSRALVRLDGAESPRKNVRFGLGHQGKSVFIPLSTLDPANSPSSGTTNSVRDQYEFGHGPEPTY